MTDDQTDYTPGAGDCYLDQLAQILDAAAATHRHWRMARRGREALGLPLGADLPDDRPPAELAVAWALDYHVETVDDEGRRRIRLAPTHEHTDGTEPPLASEVADDVAQVWRDLLGRVSAPAAKARLAHLLVERGGGDRRELTIIAAEAYLAAAAADERSMDAVVDMTAATRLARSVGDDALNERSLEQMTVLVEKELAQPEPPAGVVIRALRHLVGETASPARLDELLERTTQAWTDPHRQDGALEVLLERSRTPEDRAAVWRRRVEVFTSAAEAAGNTLMRATRLQQALALADAPGDAQLRRQTTQLLQSVRHDQLGMMSFHASSRQFSEQFEETVGQVIQGDNWRSALIAFARTGPLSGDPDSNRAVVRTQHAQFPLASLFPTQLLGADNLPLYSGTSAEDRFDVDLTRWEVELINQLSRIVATGLVEIPERHGLPALEELAVFLASWPGLDEDVAPLLARSLIRFWTGDPEGAAFTAAPRLETIARNLVLRLDLAIYRAQRERTPGQYAALGVLLAALFDEGAIDEGQQRYLTALLTKPAGHRLRNDMLHGFTANVGLGGAALLLHAALLLGTVEAQPRGQVRNGETGEEPLAT